MKGTVVGQRGRHEPFPILNFNIEIENDTDQTIVFINVISNVSTTTPMSRFELGRLQPCEHFMCIDAKESRSFPFDLELDFKGLHVIEDARERSQDVFIDIHMRTLFMYIEDWSPIRFGWQGFHVGNHQYDDRIRIPKSDWLQLRDDLGYGKMRTIEVSEDTYDLIEKFLKQSKARDLDEAIHTAILHTLRKEPEE